METVIRYLVLILATYRVSHMIVSEEGPFEVFIRWRSYMYGRFSESERFRWIDAGFACVLCVSFWLSWISGVWGGGVYPLDSLAIAGGCLVLHKALYR